MTFQHWNYHMEAKKNMDPLHGLTWKSLQNIALNEQCKVWCYLHKKEGSHHIKKKVILWCDGAVLWDKGEGKKSVCRDGRKQTSDDLG